MKYGVPPAGAASRPLTQRDCRNLWYSVARLRKERGDIDGARRALFAARLIGSDTRRRHDQGHRSHRWLR